jgi:hypothetical protein
MLLSSSTYLHIHSSVVFISAEIQQSPLNNTQPQQRRMHTTSIQMRHLHNESTLHTHTHTHTHTQQDEWELRLVKRMDLQHTPKSV